MTPLQVTASDPLSLHFPLADFGGPPHISAPATLECGEPEQRATVWKKVEKKEALNQPGLS